MRFRLFGIPVQFHWTFLIVAAVLGASQRDPNALLIWVGVVVVSVLVHEFGHAFAARYFRQSPSIVLHSFGGLTSFGGHGLGPRQRLLITLAGPGAGFVLGFILLAVGPPSVYYLRVAWAAGVWVNFGWGILNMLPILPLDGGHALDEILTMRSGRPNRPFVHRISAFAAGGLAVIALVNGMLYLAILAGFMAYSNWASYKNLSNPFFPGGWR